VSDPSVDNREMYWQLDNILGNAVGGIGTPRHEVSSTANFKCSTFAR
jgi:hypothetical protein